ncbi:hypothetical protein D1AOALGA4SA_9744 [Olavius algarvensis Delta 1 endosymbiont]|nr:hypothetical protein D1AOALGA4SA_9744 [Olavius algarvensis Delta 1 endosymbiont]
MTGSWDARRPENHKVEEARKLNSARAFLTTIEPPVYPLLRTCKIQQ